MLLNEGQVANSPRCPAGAKAEEGPYVNFIFTAVVPGIVYMFLRLTLFLLIVINSFFPSVAIVFNVDLRKERIMS